MGGGLLIGNEMIWIWFIWDVKKVFSLKQIIRLRIWTSHGMAGQTKKAYPQQTLKPTCFNDKILELMTLFQLGILIFFSFFCFLISRDLNFGTKCAEALDNHRSLSRDKFERYDDLCASSGKTKIPNEKKNWNGFFSRFSF